MRDPVQASLNLLFCTAGLCVLVRGRHGLWATTLRAAWLWAVFSLFAVTTIEMVLGLATVEAQDHSQTLRFAAAMLAFTPTMALLGAKRPQNAAWQFVVITLWGVLALPALAVWMRGRGEDLVIDIVRSWFFVVMIVVGVVNHLPTRFGLAAAQFALAQGLLLWPYLPFGGSSESRPPVWLPLGLFLSSALTARSSGKRHGRASLEAFDVPQLRPWNGVWRDFRDWFGTVWGVRVMEQVNATALVNEWPVVLGWEGFVWRQSNHPPLESDAWDDTEKRADDRAGGATATGLGADQKAAIEQSLGSLLRRFVSAEWMEERLKAHDV